MNGLHLAKSDGPLLRISDLSVTLFTANTTVRAVDHVDYSVAQGEVLAIVGESGSGKTVLNLAPLGLLPAGVTVDVEGRAEFRGVNLLGATEAQLQSIRGGEIAVIFQDPLSALNPVRRIGPQIAEVAERHLGLTAAAAAQRTIELLTLVGIPDPASRMRQYPHELSGGMRQRVGIAMSIAGEPKLLIADEPTTALDVTVQAQIVDLLKSLQKRLGMSVVLITHDIGVVSGMANKIAVMYAGRVVEFGSVDDVLLSPSHPYTRGLLASVPTLTAPIGTPFVGLRGTPPDTSRRITGCPFVPRCDDAIAECSATAPPLVPIGAVSDDHLAACPVVAPPVRRMRVAL
jgi:peptide/nickel transport system ATP-binding protein